MTPAAILGIDAGERDPGVIKRAYAKLLREHRPDRDPEGFRRIRDAYEALTLGTARVEARPIRPMPARPPTQTAPSPRPADHEPAGDDPADGTLQPAATSPANARPARDEPAPRRERPPQPRLSELVEQVEQDDPASALAALLAWNGYADADPAVRKRIRRICAAEAKLTGREDARARFMEQCGSALLPLAVEAWIKRCESDRDQVRRLAAVWIDRVESHDYAADPDISLRLAAAIALADPGLAARLVDHATENRRDTDDAQLLLLVGIEIQRLPEDLRPRVLDLLHDPRSTDSWSLGDRLRLKKAVKKMPDHALERRLIRYAPKLASALRLGKPPVWRVALAWSLTVVLFAALMLLTITVPGAWIGFFLIRTLFRLISGDGGAEPRRKRKRRGR
jgi:hypothetical protein